MSKDTAPGLALGNRLLRLPAVLAKTARSRAATYAAIKKGSFPAPVQIGSNSVAWLEAEVDQWIEDRLAERDRQRLQPSYKRDSHAP